MQNKLYVYDELIDLLQDLHQKPPDKGYDRKALEIFERKQGRVFLEEMGQSGARLFVGVPEAILQHELDLENQVEQTRKQLVDERSKIITEQNKELIQTLAPFREKREVFINNPDRVWELLEMGNTKARTVARQTMEEVRTALGF